MKEDRKDTERKDFLRGYWGQYLLIEKEFMETLPYVSLCEDNYNAFSDAYLKLILQIGSAVDVALKKYCSILKPGPNADNIKAYRVIIADIVGEKFTNELIKLKNSAYDLPPINTWQEWNTPNSPEWWHVYNNVKHNRTQEVKICKERDNKPGKKSYKYANQKYTLQALAGLYQVLAFTYHEIVKDNCEFVPYPTPESKLFRPVFEGRTPDGTSLVLI